MFLLAPFAHILGDLGALPLLFGLLQRLQLIAREIFCMVDDNNIEDFDLVVGIKMCN